MKKETKKQHDALKKQCFEQLVSEIKEQYNNVSDIFYSDHRGMWVLVYNSDISDDEFVTFSDLCDFLIKECDNS